jgi:ABC-type spermidine/putrescine transport system permease subunit II
MTDGKREWSALGLYALGVLAFLYLPIATMAVFSFHDSTTNALPWRGFTLKWYAEALANPHLWVAFRNSVVLGLLTAMTAVLLGTAMAFAFRVPFRGKSLILTLFLLPIMTPPIVHGVALIMFWRAADLRLSLFGSTFIGHVTFVLPFVFLTIFPRIHRFERVLEEAAMDLGATPLATFRRITFPLIRPGVVAGGVLAFALSFDEFLRTLFLTGADVTLPLLLWSMVTNDLSPQPNAVATMITIVSLGCLAVWARFASR